MVSRCRLLGPALMHPHRTQPRRRTTERPPEHVRMAASISRTLGMRKHQPLQEDECLVARERDVQRVSKQFVSDQHKDKRRLVTRCPSQELRSSPAGERGRRRDPQHDQAVRRPNLTRFVQPTPPGRPPACARDSGIVAAQGLRPYPSRCPRAPCGTRERAPRGCPGIRRECSGRPRARRR